MVSLERQFGGYQALAVSLATSVSLRYNPDIRMASIGFNNTGYFVNLPDLTETYLPTGQFIFTLLNFNVNAFTVRDNTNGTGFSIVCSALETVSLHIVDDASESSGRNWIGLIRAYNT